MPDSLFRLDTKIAAIIGAGSGIGAAVAAGAARQGADVICLDVDEASADRVARGIGVYGIVRPRSPWTKPFRI